MDPTKIKECMDRLEELVEDKHETVTYMMLSEEFKITTVDAREVMEKYIETRKERDPESIGLLYVVYGITKEEGRNFVAVMTPSAMEEQKEKLNDCHTMLLSIYKTASKDSSIQPDPFGIFRATKAPLLGCIVSRNAVKRKFKSRLVAAQPSTTKTEADVKKPVAKAELPNHSNGSKKQNGLGNFLSKGISKLEIEKNPPPKPKAKSAMANFLSKAPTKSTEDTQEKKSQDEKVKEIKKENPSEPSRSKIVHDIKMETEENEEKCTKAKKHKLIDTDDSDDEIPVKKPNVKEAQSQTKKQKRPRKENKKKKKDEQPSKKRRRIINDEKSDSDDVFGSDNDEAGEDEDIIDGTDSEEVKVSTIVAAKNPRKVRKKVSDMFLEEEGGYFQTVNKWEYESASDKEEEKEQKPNNALQPKKVEVSEKKSETPTPKLNISPPKPVKNGKGKAQKVVPQNQTSITSFFKKK